MVYWVILHPETEAAGPHERDSAAARQGVAERLGPFESRERASSEVAARAARERHRRHPGPPVRLEVVCDYA